MNQKNPILSEHFERLKELIPEVYTRTYQPEETESSRLYALLKKTLGIIEAVYLQDQAMFHQARVEEYGKIIEQLRAMGYEYNGNEELLEKAASQLIMGAKKPMKKAKGARRSSEEGRKAM